MVAGDKGSGPARVLFDTGASVSIVARAFAEKVATVVRAVRPVTFTLADGSQVPAADVATLSVEIGGKLLTDSFVVMDNLSEDVIVGLATLRKFQIRIDTGRDAILAALKTNENNFKETQMELIKKLFAKLGLEWKDGTSEEDAIAQIAALNVKPANVDDPPKDEPKDEPKEAAAAPDYVLTALGLDKKASEADVKGKLLALKHPGDTVKASDYAELKAKLHEKEVSETLAVAQAEGKLAAAEMAWAKQQAESDLAAFKVFLKDRPATVPMAPLPAKKDEGDPRLAALSAEQIAINKQLGIDEETFRKFN